MQISQFSDDFMLKDSPFSIGWDWPPVSLVNVCVSMPGPNDFISCSSAICFEVGTCKPPASIFLDCSGSLGSVEIPYEMKDDFFYLLPKMP